MSNAIPSTRVDALPLQRRDAPVVDAAQQQAWQREMERAQLADWFRPTADRTGREAGPAAPDPQAKRAHRPAGSHGDGSTRTTRPAPLRSVALPGASAEASDSQTSRHVGGAMTAAPTRASSRTTPGPSAGSAMSASFAWLGHRPPTVAAPQPKPTATAAATHPAPAGPPHADTDAPLRLHAEMRPQGQIVWLAMRADDSALLAQLPRIVTDLQRELRARGEQLHQVVCNGRLVWCDGASFFPSPHHPKEP